MIGIQQSRAFGVLTPMKCGREQANFISEE
jgi:hypothetical protein